MRGDLLVLISVISVGLRKPWVAIQRKMAKATKLETKFREERVDNDIFAMYGAEKDHAEQENSRLTDQGSKMGVITRDGKIKH